MHPEYVAVYAVMQDRIRVAENRRRVRAARAAAADRPPRASRRSGRVRQRSVAGAGGAA